MAPRRSPKTAALVVVSVLGAVACGGGGGGSVKAFCRTVTQGENPLAIFDRYDPADPSAARATMQKGVERLKQMQASAPRGEVRDSLGTLVSVAEKLSAALVQRASDPSSSQAPDFSYDSNSVGKASATVTRFASDNCRVQLDSSIPPASSSTPAGGSTPASS